MEPIRGRLRGLKSVAPEGQQDRASAFAFFGGDIYLFTEALPTECWLLRGPSAPRTEPPAARTLPAGADRVRDQARRRLGRLREARARPCSLPRRLRTACLVSSRARVTSDASTGTGDSPGRALTVESRGAITSSRGHLALLTTVPF
ncbi:MAG: hypothetical protein M5U28_07595 [Sandaracinaceae bacterium]|nr:hypothetical protein [Sandaracinaceae bacterium]